jgi:hypothetical protein
MWLKHPAWIPIAWLLSVLNVAAVWFAARPGEAWHATTHALLALIFGVGAQWLNARRRTLNASRGGAESFGEIAALREEFAALREGQAQILKRLEPTLDALAVELERVGENQRFLTKVIADPSRSSEGGTHNG